MGIPSYFSYIVKNYPEIIKKFTSTNLHVDNLYLDCNSIIYDCYHKLLSDEKINTSNLANILIKDVCSKIDYYVALIMPTKRVMIAFDGVAPVAKLEQQRSRRYKSTYQNDILKEIYNNKKPDVWNTTAITPGTVFMEDLTKYIKNYYQKDSIYILSTSEIYGEGEHKIFEYMRENSLIHEKDTTIIYGLDADLIMLSINHLSICENIYLFRETPHFIQSINKDLDPLENYLLDIPQLTNSILLFMNNDIQIENNIKMNKINDYIFLSFLLGNDFLPHFPAINIRTGGMEKLLNAYRAKIGASNSLINDKTINWNNFRKLIEWLAIKEEGYLQEEYKLRNKREKFYYETDTPEKVFKKFEALPTYEREMEKYINPFQDYWQERYYKTLFDIKSDSNGTRRKQICLNYMQGLEWTMKYYTSGCPNWRWYYKYHYPPLLSDLLKYIPVFNTTFIQELAPSPVSPLVQLSYVLPLSSLQLLPDKLRKKLLESHPEWYEKEYEFVWCFCRYFWESHVKMAPINIDELEAIVNSL
jgi:5'-3' exonuclease